MAGVAIVEPGLAPRNPLDERTAVGGVTIISDLRGIARELQGSAQRYYTRDPGGTLRSQRNGAGGGATSRYYLTDALGSITAMISPTGTAVRTYRYTPWGETTTATGTIPNPFTYAGGYQETYSPSGTILIKFGTRYYQPNLGRWTQPEPLGAVMDRYGYTASDPVNATDVRVHKHRRRRGHRSGRSWGSRLRRFDRVRRGLCSIHALWPELPRRPALRQASPRRSRLAPVVTSAERPLWERPPAA